MTQFNSKFKTSDIILYYADFLSLQEMSIPVTDNCKYYFIHNLPVNSDHMLDTEPNYDSESKYIKKAQQEYDKINDKFGEVAAIEFIKKICDLAAYGCINAEQMLKFIHRFSTKVERKQAFNIYNNWKRNQKYTHQTINDNGDIEERECTRFVYNAEKNNKISKISKSAPIHINTVEENIKND